MGALRQRAKFGGRSTAEGKVWWTLYGRGQSLVGALRQRAKFGGRSTAEGKVWWALYGRGQSLVGALRQRAKFGGHYRRGQSLVGALWQTVKFGGRLMADGKLSLVGECHLHYAILSRGVPGGFLKGGHPGKGSWGGGALGLHCQPKRGAGGSRSTPT